MEYVMEFKDKIFEAQRKYLEHLKFLENVKQMNKDIAKFQAYSRKIRSLPTRGVEPLEIDWKRLFL